MKAARGLAFALAICGASPGSAADIVVRGGFVTTLGADTVAVECYTRTSDRLEGDIVLRVPGTTRYHYELTFRKDGSVRRSVFAVKPSGAPAVDEHRRLTMDFDDESVRIISLARGEQVMATKPGRRDPNVLFLGGYGASFGIYSSFGMYEHLLTRLPVNPETVIVPAFSAATGDVSNRRFKRRSPLAADVDFFKIAWTHITLDEAGRIISADATETTEKTLTKRVEFIDIGKAEKEFLALDKAGKGIGSASPNVETKASVAGVSIVVKYGSPRLRGRSGVVSALAASGGVWRTGANEATTIELSRDLAIGTERIPAGKYSLWTLAKADGVQLIVNKEAGQWGTAYKPAQDLIRMPMRVSTSDTPLENLTIDVRSSEGGGELRIRWDTFIWSVSILPVG